MSTSRQFEGSSAGAEIIYTSSETLIDLSASAEVSQETQTYSLTASTSYQGGRRGFFGLNFGLNVALKNNIEKIKSDFMIGTQLQIKG